MSVIYDYPATGLIISKNDWYWDEGRDVFEFCAYPVEGFAYDPLSDGINWRPVGYTSRFWTASEYNNSTARYRSIHGVYLNRHYDIKYYGLQVRCVKDDS